MAIKQPYDGVMEMQFRSFKQVGDEEVSMFQMDIYPIPTSRREELMELLCVVMGELLTKYGFQEASYLVSAPAGPEGSVKH